MEKEFNIFIRSDNRAVCPTCKGLCTMNIEHQNLHCNDCGSSYIHIGNTNYYSEHVMRYRRAGNRGALNG
ncbi:MAG: hypothetical protein K2N41_09585 [Lachnospiraceae bacterium]|nr:hypothetical protein [Lachnospiraceae bacterium]MDE7239945.1 hypothetical protein [Lachnospiraceae bacterium]